ncbi:ABC transporter ATP-binding protein [Corynebacterium sp. H113]|uniref:ABC transporter ATP-binding protein n=1 Tax=Corynebacterium sp. H113 TaxID=3133419 RepID=UPI0030A0E6F4
MNTIISSHNLVKSFPNAEGENTVLHGIDVSIEPGEFVAIMGPSGSGKSTLLNTLSGMDEATSGEIFFSDEPIHELSQKRLAELRLTKMGFVFQQIHLLKNLSLLDNIIFPGFSAQKVPRAEVVEHGRELMNRVGLNGLEDRTVAQASGGQLQRVGICRALINDPDVLFCDEPTGALNSTSASEIMDLLCEINNEGTTVVVVTHDVKVATRCERVLFLVDGQIVGDRQQGKDDPDQFTARYTELSTWLIDQGF